MNILSFFATAVFGLVSMTSCNGAGNNTEQALNKTTNKTSIMGTVNTNDSTRTIYFAGGCFWGTEHFFEQINGVTETEVGFANGHTKNPSYHDVVYNNTGFAETVKVTYDPKVVDLNLLLNLYFLTIDPTSLNRQGNDFGTQYRTGIYYTSEDQLPVIEDRVKAESTKYTSPIVVEVTPLKNYYKAEEYHQDYLDKNPGGYCHINPELFKVAAEANRKK